MKLARVLLLFSMVLAFTAAQTTGSISGEVRDEKQSVVTNATIIVRNVKTNDTRTAQTDNEGRYRFTGMRVGDYEVTVEAKRKKKYVQTGISLLLGQSATVDVVL